MTDRELTIIGTIACEDTNHGEWGVEKNKGIWSISMLFDLDEECSDTCPDTFGWTELDESRTSILEKRLGYFDIVPDRKYRTTGDNVVLIFDLTV